jgi:hypothetical protein
MDVRPAQGIRLARLDAPDLVAWMRPEPVEPMKIVFANTRR